MTRFHLVSALTLGLCLIVQTGLAMEAYVTDSFEVTLRTGPSIENRIIGMPASGQPLEVLDTQGDWTLVRFQTPGRGSVEGWLLSRYVITRVPWELQSRTLKEENGSLKGKLARVEKERGEATRDQQMLGEKLKETAEALHKAESAYESLKHEAADYLKLKEAYTANQSTLKSTQKELQGLIEEHRRLSSLQRNRWFLAGALVLLCGLIIGLVIGRRERKRRQSLYQ
jgi:SH3 domain protein